MLRDGRGLGDAVTSRPAPLRPYQAAAPRSPLIEPAASQSLAEIDCVAVSITSCEPLLSLPLPFAADVRFPGSGPRWLFICYGLFSFEPE